MIRGRRLTLVALVAIGCLAIVGEMTSAGAHAQLLSSSPAAGGQLDRVPDRVKLRFSEGVDATFGGLKVFDSRGRRIDTGEQIQPGGENKLAVELRSGLGSDSYTVIYRVISADSHPISGGFVFSVGTAGAPPRSVDSLLAGQQISKVQSVGFDAVRAAGFLALALIFGGAIFGAFVLMPSARSTRSAAAEEAYAIRAHSLFDVAIVLGIAASTAAIIFQVAAASGESPLRAISFGAFADLAATRSGLWMLLRLLFWCVLATSWLLYARRGTRGGTRIILFFGVACVQSTILIGHAATTSPTLVAIPIDFVHVVAMSVWIGGLAHAAWALPAATRQLAATRRTQLLVEIFGRFSIAALVSVVLIVISGTVASIMHLEELGDLWSTAYGRAIAIKCALLAVLMVLGAFNKYSILPRLRAKQRAGETPGAVGGSLRRTVSAELAIAFVVVAVAGILVGQAPPTAVASGPIVENSRFGPAELQTIIESRRVGPVNVHLFMTDPNSGKQLTSAKGTTVTARRGGGPSVDFAVLPSGPGHYIATGVFTAPGQWIVTVSARSSAFDLHESRIKLRVRE